MTKTEQFAKGGRKMAFIDEQELMRSLKAGKLSNAYLLFGEEVFLTETYVRKIVKKALGKEPSDFNLIKLGGNTSVDELSSHTEGLPFFADYKCVVISDLAPEKLNNDEHKALIALIDDLPETTILLIYITGFAVDVKKAKAKTKKLIAAVEKAGTVCEFKHMTTAKISELIMKKVVRAGLDISVTDARFLAEATGNSLVAVGNETDKLCAYMQSGVITREIIESLVPKQADARVYDLADKITAGKTALALKILGELLYQRIEPIVIMSVLSGAYLDFYRAALARQNGLSPRQAAADFSYPKNKEFLITKAFNSVGNRLEYFRNSLQSLYNADLSLKSTSADSTVILERLVVELSTAVKAG